MGRVELEAVLQVASAEQRAWTGGSTREMSRQGNACLPERGPGLTADPCCVHRDYLSLFVAHAPHLLCVTPVGVTALTRASGSFQAGAGSAGLEAAAPSGSFFHRRPAACSTPPTRSRGRRFRSFVLVILSFLVTDIRN